MTHQGSSDAGEAVTSSGLVAPAEARAVFTRTRTQMLIAGDEAARGDTTVHNRQNLKGGAGGSGSFPVHRSEYVLDSEMIRDSIE